MIETDIQQLQKEVKELKEEMQGLRLELMTIRLIQYIPCPAPQPFTPLPAYPNPWPMWTTTTKIYFDGSGPYIEHGLRTTCGG